MKWILVNIWRRFGINQYRENLVFLQIPVQLKEIASSSNVAPDKIDNTINLIAIDEMLILNQKWPVIFISLWRYLSWLPWKRLHETLPTLPMGVMTNSFIENDDKMRKQNFSYIEPRHFEKRYLLSPQKQYAGDTRVS